MACLTPSHSTHDSSLKLQDGGWRVLPQGSHFKKGSPAERTWGHEKYAQNPKKHVPFLISSLKNLLFCPFFNEIENLNPLSKLHP